MYANGQGVTQDYAEALKWFRLAAERGDPSAQYALGLMYQSGRGLSRDYILAHLWFDLSAAQGTKIAVTSRDRIERQMAPAQIAEAQKLAREWKAKPEEPPESQSPFWRNRRSFKVANLGCWGGHRHARFKPPRFLHRHPCRTKACTHSGALSVS